MKNLQIFLIFLLISYLGNSTPVARQKPNFSLKVSFEEMVRLKSARLVGVDSTAVEVDLHTHVFSGFINPYCLAGVVLTYVSLTEMKEKSVSLTLFLQPGKTTLFFKVDPAQYMLNGASSESHAMFRGLQIRDEAINRKIKAIVARLNDSSDHFQNPEREKQKDSIAHLKQQRKENIYAAFIRTNPNSLVSLYAVSMYGKINLGNPLQVEKLIGVLADSLQYSEQVRALRQKLRVAKTLMVGNVAPDFSQPDTSGKAIKLSDLRGKFILINFWASWCKPSRDRNRGLVPLYKKYQNSGFEILAVSLDSHKTAWAAAISEDKLEWLHVSDLKIYQNEVASLYQIRSVPQNYLLDTNGKIIARNLDEQELSGLLDRLTFVTVQGQKK